MINTPVLLLIFNRPETTKVVFDSIRKNKPKKLYIAADGPRKGNERDIDMCEKTRNIVCNIDWNCEVKKLFRGDNLGCGKGPAEAITWFFDNEEKGIILEDDCVPDNSFFRFCEELLEKYKDDERVMMISGDNFQNGKKRNVDSYYFSRHCHCWGWASWRRSWNKFDYFVKSWPRLKKENRLKEIIGGDYFVFKYWERVFDYVYKNRSDIWDYQWTYACLINSGMSIIPCENLVSNIGFGKDATHTSGKSIVMGMKTSKIKFPLIHPEFVVRDFLQDSRTDYKSFITLRGVLGLLYYSLIRKSE